MASDDNALAQATDDLIALYRSLERRTLDLPVISFAPLLIASLASLEFALLFSFALLLMIPVNLAILIRNVFPGHWQYRPFFFTQVGYVLRWIWRGEPPSGPTIFVRPLFNFFMKGHFDRRLRRLRQEVVLSDSNDHPTLNDLTWAHLHCGLRLEFQIRRGGSFDRHRQLFIPDLEGLVAAAKPAAASWLWTLAYGHHEDRTPTHGYEPTREAAMVAFARSWWRE